MTCALTQAERTPKSSQAIPTTSKRVRAKPTRALQALKSNAHSIESSKSALRLAKTALDLLGGFMQRQDAGSLAKIGARVVNLGGLFGSMAQGYAINEFGQSMARAVGGALALRREVSGQSLLHFLGSSALAASEGLGAVGFLVARGVLAVGSASAGIEMISMAALAIGAALMLWKAFLAIRAERSAPQGAEPSAERAAKLSQLKWMIAKMAILVAVGLLGVASAASLASLPLAMASTSLMTILFASDLLLKLRGRTLPRPEETAPEGTLTERKGKLEFFRDQLSPEDANPNATDPNLSARQTWAAQERAAQATQDLFSTIHGQKTIQGFTRGIGEVACLAAHAAGREALAETISTNSNLVAGGLLPHAEVVANAAGLVEVLKSSDSGSAGAVAIGKAGAKVVVDVAKVTGLMVKFKVIDLARSSLKSIDLVGKSADFVQALLTLRRSAVRSEEPAAAQGASASESSGEGVKNEINRSKALKDEWIRLKDWAKLALTILALLPSMFAALGRGLPSLALRIASTAAGLTMGTAAAAAHYLSHAGRYKLDPQEVEEVG